MRRDVWSVFTVVVALLGLVLLGQPVAADSHEEPAPPGYSIIHFEHVGPANSTAFQENAKAWVAAFKEAGLGEEYSWRAYSGPNFTYAYVSDLPNYAYLDSGDERDKAVEEAIGEEKMAELIGAIVGNSHYSELTKRLPKLSYVPEGGIGKFGFVRLGRHHVKPGMGEKFRKLAAKVAEARKQVGSSMPVLASRVEFGRGNFQFVTLAENEDAFHAAPSTGAILNEAFGAEKAQAMFDEWRDCITDYETSDWWLMPDLSYMPGMYEEDEAMMEKEEMEDGE